MDSSSSFEQLDSSKATLPVANEHTEIESASRASFSVEAVSIKDGTTTTTTSSKGQGSDNGRREEVAPTLAGFDTLRFKNNFLEMVEELRLLRTIKSESEEHVEQLLKEKHELTNKLDEAVSHSTALMEDHGSKFQELTQKHEEQLQQYIMEQVKSSAIHESREKEMKALKDEMRALHLTKHILEKKVQEQERQIQLHFSSRDDYLSKMTHLEERCSSLFKMAEDANEHMETLEANVKQAKELHHQLEYVNTHQRCEVQMAKLKLEACQQELIESRASKRMELDGMNAEAQDSVANLKTAKQELKMQEELCRHLQTQLSALRAEHESALVQIKEGHTLLERHVDNANRAMQNEEGLKKKVDDLESDVQVLEDKVAMAEKDYKVMKEKYAIENSDLQKKLLDTEQRLSTLQSDYKLLQDAYDQLEASRDTMKGELTVEKEELKTRCAQLEEDMINVGESEATLREKTETLQCALDQSEFQLAECEKRVKEKDEVISSLSDVISGMKRCGRVEDSTREIFATATAMSSSGQQLSPEIIPSLPDACGAAWPATQHSASSTDQVNNSSLRVSITPCAAPKISHTSSTSLMDEDCTVDQVGDGNSHTRPGMGTKEPAVITSTSENLVGQITHSPVEQKIDGISQSKVDVSPPKGSATPLAVLKMEMSGLSPSRGCASHQTTFSPNGNMNDETVSLSPQLKKCSTGGQTPFSPSKGNVNNSLPSTANVSDQTPSHKETLSSEVPSSLPFKQCPSGKSSEQLYVDPLRGPTGLLKGSASNQTPSTSNQPLLSLPTSSVLFKREIIFGGDHPNPKKIKLDTPSCSILEHDIRNTEDVENGSRNMGEEHGGTRKDDEDRDNMMEEDVARNMEENHGTRNMEENHGTRNMEENHGTNIEENHGTRNMEKDVECGSRNIEDVHTEMLMDATSVPAERNSVKLTEELEGGTETCPNKDRETREVCPTEEGVCSAKEGAGKVRLTKGGDEKVQPIEGEVCLSEEGGAGKYPTKEGEEANVLHCIDQPVEGDTGEMSPLFSPEFGDEQFGGHNMLSTQMNRQINRVETFLKIDRLRRQKSTK